MREEYKVKMILSYQYASGILVCTGRKKRSAACLLDSNVSVEPGRARALTWRTHGDVFFSFFL